MNALRTSCLALLAACSAAPRSNSEPALAVVDDFEAGVRAWEDASNVKARPSIRETPEARIGKCAAEIRFPPNAEGWTNLFRPVEWPAEGNAIRFWIKAPTPCRSKLKLNEMKRGLNHNAYEGYTASIEAGPAWTQLTVRLSEFAYSWGHPDGNKTLDPDRISTLGFEPENLAQSVEILVDHIEILRAPARVRTVDDFSSGVDALRWTSKDSGAMRSEIRSSAGAARVEFSGTRGAGSWTDLYVKFSWPEDPGFDTVCFRARADAPSRVIVKINQGLRHDELEMYGKTLELGTGWRRYRVPLSEFTELIFSHLQMDGGKASGRIDPKQIFGIGFVEPPDAALPMVFHVDDIEVEASR